MSRRAMCALLRDAGIAVALTAAAIGFASSDVRAHETKVGDLVINHPWSRPSPMAPDVAAGFMKITNNGSADDRLLTATASISPKVQLHDMKMDGDVMKMIELPQGIVIPAGQTVELKPRSLHLMFLDLTEQPMPGVSFTGTLVFEKAGTVEIDYEVVPPGAGMGD